MSIPWSSQEIQRFQDYFRISQQDQDLLRDVLPLATRLRQPFVNGLYTHFAHFSQTAAFFPDPETLARAKAGQAEFYLKLFAADIDEDYLNYLWDAGELHERLGLEPSWYMGCYAYYASTIIPTLAQSADNKPSEHLWQTVAAFAKVACLDIATVWTSYYQSRESRLAAINADLEHRHRELQAVNQLNMQVLNERAQLLEEKERLIKELERRLENQGAGL